MKSTAKKTLWWGIGVLILGVISYVAYTSAGFQSEMVNQLQNYHSFFFYVISPGLIIIQNLTFPLGSALVGASIVIHKFDEVNCRKQENK